MNRPLRLSLILISALALIRPAACQNQNTDFKPLLSGGSLPLTFTLKDMDSAWRRVSLGTPAGGADPTQSYLALLTGGAGNAYYTKGETVMVAGETFLIAYHRQVKIDLQTLMKGGGDLPKLPALTPDSALSLSLLNLRTLSSLSDIQPFSLDREVRDADAASRDAASRGQETAVTTVEAPESTSQTSLSNLKQIGLAMNMYIQDYDEKLPPMKSAAIAKKVLFPYIKSEAVFQQPQTHQPYLPNTSLSGRSLASFDSPATMVVYYEAGPAPDETRGVVFLDGHAKRIRESEWPALKAASHVPNMPPR